MKGREDKGAFVVYSISDLVFGVQPSFLSRRRHSLLMPLRFTICRLSHIRTCVNVCDKNMCVCVCVRVCGFRACYQFINSCGHNEYLLVWPSPCGSH